MKLANRKWLILSIILTICILSISITGIVLGTTLDPSYYSMLYSLFGLYGPIACYSSYYYCWKCKKKEQDKKEN